MSLGILPDANEEYGTKEYWDHRYSQETENAGFDWFKSYKDLAQILHELIPHKTSRILMLGCGNSKLSEDMWEDGYKNIVNTDYSRILIEQMKQRHGDARPEMEWHEMDVRDMKFEEESFDVAIDKGTMDAMMTAKGDVWDPPEQVIKDCNKEVDETLRRVDSHFECSIISLDASKGWIFYLSNFWSATLSQKILDKIRNNS